VPRKQVDRVARFVWIVDGEYLGHDAKGPNRIAAEATVEAVRDLGRIEPIDESMMVGFEMLAEAVDNDPTNAALWGQYRQAEAALRGAGADDDDLARLSAALRDVEDAGT
jgi:hypothetical protein